ncbi:hypothetical protein Cgig2_009475 [Carnegiea gigantea]|uniref:Uncharacterized protein n=1 Tax=Carnegiea gigantea TaxID=171969 RepID=A0A9Q1QEK2_9CARY|nr:hypothetical protein Cgig2_009475 [Carnegiea gigantea]
MGDLAMKVSDCWRNTRRRGRPVPDQLEGQGRHSAPLAHQLGHPTLHQQQRKPLQPNLVIDLFRNMRGLAVEQGAVLPKYAGFKWHPPRRENQRWPLNTDNDWSIRGFVIPIYVVELHMPSQLQKVAESLDGLQKAKEKETVQFTSPCEPTLDPSLTEARM